MATQVLAELSNKNYSSVESQLDPGINTASTHSQLERMADVFPVGKPAKTHVVGVNTSTVNGTITYSLTVESEYPSTWPLANVVLRKESGHWVILGMHVYPRTQSLETENRFTFTGKTAVHYVVFGLATAIPIFVVLTFIACVRTPLAKRKWLWLLFVAVGIGQLSFNWTNGASSIQPISFVALGSGFFRAGPYAPIILNVSVPVGAIIFWLKRWPNRAKSNVQSPGAPAA